MLGCRLAESSGFKRDFNRSEFLSLGSGEVTQAINCQQRHFRALH